MKPSEFEEMLYRVEDGVAWMQMNRPEQRNSFSSRMYGEVKWGVRAAEHDKDVDVIVLTGTGNTFASGGDLKETLSRLQGGDPEMDMYPFYDNLPWWAMRDSSKVIIAAVNGYCYAGGLITAAWCDIQIAVRSATFALTEGKVGIADAMAPSVLFGRVPTPKLKYMLFTAKSLTADEAERYGLITEVVDDDALETRVREVIDEVRGTSPVSRRMFKRYLHDLVPKPANHGGTEAFASPEVIEGLSAFAGKRPPTYREQDS